MNLIGVYTPEELKRHNPKGFEKAHSQFNYDYSEIPWQDEIMDSLKAIFKASGINLQDWSISGDYPRSSYVQIDLDYEVHYGINSPHVFDLSGPRAMAWLENNLLADLRIKYIPYGRVDNEHYWKSVRATLSKYGKYYYAGMIKPCPFTGYCADDDFIESLINDIKAGATLGEAYHNLASLAGKMFESEIEYVNSEEHFLEQEHLQFTIDGRMV